MIDGRMSDFQSYQKYVGIAQGIDLSCQSIDETIKQINIGDDSVTHQHDKIYADSLSKATIASHQLPKPLNWKILIQPAEIATQTKSGIILPETAKDNQQILTAHGHVVALGELCL